MKTKVFKGKYENTKAIWEVDDNGNQVGKAPIVSIGKKKIKAILENAEELKKYVEGES